MTIKCVNYKNLSLQLWFVCENTATKTFSNCFIWHWLTPVWPMLSHPMPHKSIVVTLFTHFILLSLINSHRLWVKCFLLFLIRFSLNILKLPVHLVIFSSNHHQTNNNQQDLSWFVLDWYFWKSFLFYHPHSHDVFAAGCSPKLYQISKNRNLLLLYILTLSWLSWR